MDQVTDHIWITNIHGVQQNSTNRFDAIITICQDDVEANVSCDHYHHYPLSDGSPPADAYNPGEFSYELFESAVETIIHHVTEGRDTLVHCHAGQSRSAMTIAAALTDQVGATYNEAFNMVSEARTGGISPSQELQEFAQRYAKSQ